MTINIPQRLDHLQKPEWSADEIEEFYGYDREALKLGGFDPTQTNSRFDVEYKMRSNLGLLSPKLAAAELGITEASVKGLAEVFTTGNPYGMALPTHATNGSFLINKNALDAWIQSVTNYRGIWGSIPQRTQRLVGAIQKIYTGIATPPKIEILRDIVYDRFQEAIETIEGDYSTAPVAAEWCAITGDPISLPHSEHLVLPNARKPAALRPDRIGWHALFDYPMLEQHTLGSLRQFHTFTAEAGD